MIKTIFQTLCAISVSLRRIWCPGLSSFFFLRSQRRNGWDVLPKAAPCQWRLQRPGMPWSLGEPGEPGSHW